MTNSFDEAMNKFDDFIPLSISKDCRPQAENDAAGDCICYTPALITYIRD